jgi:hypothetical protein
MFEGSSLESNRIKREEQRFLVSTVCASSNRE